VVVGGIGKSAKLLSLIFAYANYCKYSGKIIMGLRSTTIALAPVFTYYRTSSIMTVL